MTEYLSKTADICNKFEQHECFFTRNDLIYLHFADHEVRLTGMSFFSELRVCGMFQRCPSNAAGGRTAARGPFWAKEKEEVLKVEETAILLHAPGRHEKSLKNL